jgi:hypothetical protein
MNNSSVQTDYSITSNDIGITAQDVGSISLDTITIDTSAWNMSSGSASSYYYTGSGIGGSSNTITISNGGSSSTIGSVGTSSGTINIGSISGAGTGFNWNVTEEFVDCLPDFNRLKAMCEEYPGLKIAYEKFVTTYKLVKDDYDTPKDKRPKP